MKEFRFLEEYAKLRDTVEFWDYNSKNSALDVSIYGSFGQNSWLDNRCMNGNCTIRREILDEILNLYYFCRKDDSKNYVSLVVANDGSGYLLRVNENNMDNNNRVCPFIEIIHITCEEDMYNAYRIFREHVVLPNVYGRSEKLPKKEIRTDVFKVPYKPSEQHYLLKNFLYINLQKKEVRSYALSSFNLENVEKDFENSYKESIVRIKK